MSTDKPCCQFGKSYQVAKSLPHGEMKVDPMNDAPYWDATGVIPAWCPLPDLVT